MPANLAFTTWTNWPAIHGPIPAQSYGKFRCSYDDTLSIIGVETGEMRCSHVAISMDLPKAAYPRENWPTIHVKVNSPGVIVYAWRHDHDADFQPVRQLLRFPVRKDYFWLYNLRMIAITLQSLARLNGYQMIAPWSQFAPFAIPWQEPPNLPWSQNWQLPEPVKPKPEVPPLEQARSTLALHAAMFLPPTPTRDQVEAAYKAACRRVHPDVAGGSHAAFTAMSGAYQTLMAAFP